MKKLLSFTISLASLFSINISAFDIGSALKSAAPILSDSIAQTPALKENALLNSLTSLGITPAQAISGTAALLNSAKPRMQSSQFMELTKTTPGFGDILNSSSTSSILGSVNITDKFKALGMDASMIKQFIPIILDYAKGYVPAEVGSALSSALSD